MGELNSANADLSEGEIWTERQRSCKLLQYLPRILSRIARDLLFRSCE